MADKRMGENTLHCAAEIDPSKKLIPREIQAPSRGASSRHQRGWSQGPLKTHPELVHALPQRCFCVSRLGCFKHQSVCTERPEFVRLFFLKWFCCHLNTSQWDQQCDQTVQLSLKRGERAAAGPPSTPTLHRRLHLIEQVID